ncbi:TonB-dependent receptor OS=Rhodanobacter lindaniclasticus OX=75310 GN=B1991_18365 PE=3 SV=1 [Rhodanobacter lindaniclasticus]
MPIERTAFHEVRQRCLFDGHAARVGQVPRVDEVLAQGTATPPNAKQAQTLQTVVVTGSLIRRVDLETSNPVITIDRAQITASGKMTLGDLIQQLPAMTGGNVNPQVNNGGGTGASTVNLRGLGSNRTLVLVNGRRLMSKDPNAIPAEAIDRIEVLPTGASATYGSDAIGGVVNFILRKDYQGAQFSASVGESDRGDGDQSGYSFTFGQTTDKGSIMAGINYSKQDGVSAAERPFSVNAVSISGDTAFVGGSSSTPVGRIQLPASLAGQFGCNQVSLNPGGNSQVVSTANYHCYAAATDAYNYASINMDMTPQEHTGGFVTGEYHLNDDVSAYLDAIYQKTSSSFQLAPAVFGTDTTGATIDQNNAFNPFGVAFNAGTGNQFRSRLLAAGPRMASVGRTEAQINTGFRGSFTLADQSWNWDVGFNYGHSSTVTTSGGLVDQTALYTGPSTLNADGTATCPAGVSPVLCQFNPFDTNSANSKAAIQAALVNAPSNVYDIEKTYHAGINGGLFNLPAGTVQLALGAEYRKDYEHAIPAPQLQIDNTTGTCILGSQCISAAQGGYSTKSVYGEVFVPVLSNLPGVKSLNVTIGDRYSKLSKFGTNNSLKLAVEWKPIDDLLLRGTMAEVFRAPKVSSSPTISELYGSGSSAPLIGSDPCDGYTGAPAGSSLALACQNVPTDGSFRDTFVQSRTQAATVVQGAAIAGFPIKPEQGKSYDFGLVYSPSWVPGLSTTVDLWRVNLNDTITAVALQSLLNLCAAGSTEYCHYIHRNPNPGPNQGQILQSTVQPTGNLGSLNTSGVDFSVNYKLPQFSFGQFRVGVNSTYLKYFNQITAPGVAGSITYRNAGHFLPFNSAQASVCPDAAGVCLFPRWRAQGFVDWQLGDWTAQWRMRYIGRFQNGGPAGTVQDTAPNGVAGTVYKYGSTIYHDVTLGYDIEPFNTHVDVGVNNLFDKQPPFLYANNTLNANTDPSTFDLMGRYFFARVTVKF